MRRVMMLMRIGLILCIAALFLTPCRALGTDTVTVIGTITDAAGVPYAGGTIDATLIPTGVTPTVPKLNGQLCPAGCQITGYIQPVSINTDGTFAIVVYCNAGCSAPISPSGTQWLFTVRNKGTQPPAGYGGVSFTVTETINVNGSQDIGADLRAAAPRLLVSAAAGAGPVTGSGTNGFIPLWSSTTALGNSHCDDGITLASTITCSESINTPGNISLTTGGTVFAGDVEAGAAQGSFLGLFCDASVACTVQLGLNTANETVLITANLLTMSSISGAQLNNGSSVLIGGAKGGGTLNAQGLFVQGNPVTSLAAAANITPVTVTGPGTGLQNLQSSLVSGTGAENALGKTFRFHTGGTMLTASGKIEFTFTIGTGTGNPAISGFTPGSAGTTYGWTIDGTCSTTTAGATGAVLCAGNIAFGGSPGNTSLDSSVSPFNFSFANANVTGQLTLQMQTLFSAANGSNTATENVLTVEQLN